MLDNYPTLQFTLTGHIETSETGQYLITKDSTRLRISSTGGKEMPTGIHLWTVVPNIDSTGIIATVSIQDVQPLPPNYSQPDQCWLVGRVTLVGKKNSFVQLKVTRPGQKTLRLTLLTPLAEMKVGTLWQVLAVRQGSELYIKQATPFDDEALDEKEAPENKLVSQLTGEPQKLKISSREENAPADDMAEAVLLAHTGLTGWKLGVPVKRNFTGWEWEAQHIPSQQLARVRISAKGNNAEVYLYPKPKVENYSKETTLKTNLSVTPLGAAKGIGASCFRVLIGPYEVVLDCGTRPKGWEPLPALEYLENPDLLIVSHGHQDHLGAVPVFHKEYPGTRMICTVGTREIAHVMLTDCLKVQQREDSPELFDEDDLQSTLFRLETQPIGVDFEPLPGLIVRFINAGHILGAACIYLRYGERSLVYTGDYNTASSRTTEGLKLSDLPEADILITESTYGADCHPSRKTQETALMNAISEVVKAGGNVLIPAFALGRAQEILLAIRTSHLFQKKPVAVYVDGLVRAVTETFRDNLDLMPASVQNLVRNSNTEPFCDEKAIPPIIPIANPRERPLAIAKPSIVVASSGMLTGGASVYYASVLLERENAAIFISGYTDEESPGRLLQNLQTGDTIELDGKQVEVKAQVRRFNLSAHADRTGICQVINRVNPKHLILIHGSRDALRELSKAGDLQDKSYVHIPDVGETIEYGEAPEHLSEQQIAKIELPAEFEINIEAEVEGAWLKIPAHIVDEDPRWKVLSANGILRAKWDGFHLKISPLTSYHIALEAAMESGKDCCAVCTFFEKGICRCEESPLHTLQVAPSADCPEFVRGEEEFI
ncbi:MAG TPA: MBL fold metallo-hydrolase [Halomicronema sp.]